jgi:hypothetical protein
MNATESDSLTHLAIFAVVHGLSSFVTNEFSLIISEIRSFLTIISMSCSVEYSLEEIMALGVTIGFKPK